jgi:hypothetical protein
VAASKDADRVRADETAAPEPAVEMQVQAPSAAQPEEEVVVASHEALFAAPTEMRCDACDRPMRASGAEGDGEASEDEGFGPPGEGVYLWARGDEVRFERAPLCASCASAIGMTALMRWEIEEEEG